jgi:hypothetical protein
VLDRLARACAITAIDFYITPPDGAQHASRAAQQAEREGRQVATAARFRHAHLRRSGGSVVAADMLQRHCVRVELHKCVPVGRTVTSPHAVSHVICMMQLQAHARRMPR